MNTDQPKYTITREEGLLTCGCGCSASVTVNYSASAKRTSNQTTVKSDKVDIQVLEVIPVLPTSK
jgi:hypothetical protein